MSGAGRSTLTPDDTHNLIIDAWSMTTTWATVTSEGTPVAPGRTEVSAWSATITEDGTGKAVTLDHDAMITYMTLMMTGRDTLNLNDRIVDTIAAMLAAPDNETATDEQGQLDSIGCDAVVQFALFGKIVYG